MKELNPEQTIKKIDEETIEISTTNKKTIRKQDIEYVIADLEKQVTSYKSLLLELKK